MANYKYEGEPPPKAVSEPVSPSKKKNWARSLLEGRLPQSAPELPKEQQPQVEVAWDPQSKEMFSLPALDPPPESAWERAMKEQRQMVDAMTAQAVLTPSGYRRLSQTPDERYRQLIDLVDRGLLTREQAADLVDGPRIAPMITATQKTQIPTPFTSTLDRLRCDAEREVEQIKRELQKRIDPIVIWNEKTAHNFVRDFERDSKMRIEEYLKVLSREVELLRYHEFKVDAVWSQSHNALYLDVHMLHTQRSRIYESYSIELKIWGSRIPATSEPRKPHPLARRRGNHPLARRRGKAYWSLPNEPKNFLKES